MALPAIPTTNVRIYANIREATDCLQTSNLSLGGLIAGTGGGSVNHTFGSQGGPCDTMPDATLATEQAPHSIGEVRGFSHDDGGGAPFP